jgi:TfoX/Sxy family transcriptional regulator of competence genes
MPLAKPSAALIQQFDTSLPADPSVERRKMFGMPAAFCRGHMFAGLHESNMVLRLPDPDLNDFFEREGAAPFSPMADRPMSNFAVVPAAVLHDQERLRHWVERAFVGAAARPAKEPKARKRSSKSA